MKDIHGIFCDECGIGLSSKEKLTIHKETKQCQKASESIELRKKAKTKVCSVCKETFVGVLKLRTHQLTVHDMKPGTHLLQVFRASFLMTIQSIED
jgi:hypothetical protein